MRKSSYIIIILSILLYANSAKGQYPCPNNNTFYATVPAPTVVGNSASLNSIYGVKVLAAPPPPAPG